MSSPQPLPEESFACMAEIINDLVLAMMRERDREFNPKPFTKLVDHVIESLANDNSNRHKSFFQFLHNNKPTRAAFRVLARERIEREGRDSAASEPSKKAKQ